MRIRLLRRNRFGVIFNFLWLDWRSSWVYLCRCYFVLEFSSCTCLFRKESTRKFSDCLGLYPISVFSSKLISQSPYLFSWVWFLFWNNVTVTYTIDHMMSSVSLRMKPMIPYTTHSYVLSLSLSLSLWESNPWIYTLHSFSLSISPRMKPMLPYTAFSLFLSLYLSKYETRDSMTPQILSLFPCFNIFLRTMSLHQQSLFPSLRMKPVIPMHHTFSPFLFY